MSWKLYNKKTKTAAICERPDWTICRDHTVSKGWGLYDYSKDAPNATAYFNTLDEIAENDAYYENLEGGSVSAEGYAQSAGVEIYDMGKEDLEKEVLGNSIVSIEDKKITLSNGKVLEIEDTGDCCAWFEGDVKAFDFADNIVTGVEEIKHEGTKDAPESWTLRVLSKHKTLAEINIEGDSTSGYYCHSVNLNVKG
jgi:hypothetical protein